MPKTLFGDDRFVGFDSWDISLWAGNRGYSWKTKRRRKEMSGAIELGDR